MGYSAHVGNVGSVTWPSQPRERGAGGVKLSAALAPADHGPSL